MSEEEIIKVCQNLWFDVDYFGIYYNKEENKDELAEQAIQGLLDLYNKEKEKNKRNKKIILDKLDKLKNGIENDFPITLGERRPLWEENKKDYISKDKIKEEFDKFTSHNNCFNLGDIQLLLDNILEEE